MLHSKLSNPGRNVYIWKKQWYNLKKTTNSQFTNCFPVEWNIWSHLSDRMSDHDVSNSGEWTLKDQSISSRT